MIPSAAAEGSRHWLADATDEVRKAIKAESEPSGLIVTLLRAAGAIALTGLRIGILITHADTKQLTSAADLATVDAPTAQSPLLLGVVRDGSPNFDVSATYAHLLAWPMLRPVWGIQRLAGRSAGF